MKSYHYLQITRKYGNFISKLIVALFLVTKLSSCNKWIEVDPPLTSLNGENVYNNPTSAAASLTGIYIDLVNTPIDGGGGLTSVTTLGGLASDELRLAVEDRNLLPFFTNSLLSTTRTIWQPVYANIFNANLAIEGLSSSSSLPKATKNQLLGEAKFIRAFCYFYLVNLYGDVPLALSSDYSVNASLPRTKVATVYNQIISDLKASQELLSENFVDAFGNPSTERVRPSKWAATCLLARTYLFINDFFNAEKQSTLIIDNRPLIDTVPINSVFSKNSKETIWALQPVRTGSQSNTSDGQFFVPQPLSASSRTTYLTQNLLNQFSILDKRRSGWIGNHVLRNSGNFYPYKYKIGIANTSTAEYSIVLRLAEQYLIRAEARAQQGRLEAALTDLNIVRKRAGIEYFSSTDKSSVLAEISKERRLELFCEWGHRWLDLKRLNQANSVLSLLKGSNWQPSDQLFPLPQYDIDRNPALTGSQNHGY